MASARLRKAFHYPDDSGDDDAREELDEEEQEQMIVHFKAQNEKRNSQYSLIFAAIPLLSTISFVQYLLPSAALGLSARLLSVLSILSLIATAYTSKYVQPQRPDPKGKRPMRTPGLREQVHQYIIPGNAGVCLFLGLVYIFSSETSDAMQPVVYLVPAALLTTLLLVRQVMVSVDLKSLEDLRYEFKGA
ncbi:hypothetical protein BDV18DRAFT_86399 [Aspergillus unguis]